MPEERKRKSSQSEIDAMRRYKSKCVEKRVEFKPSEKDLLEYAVHTAEQRDQSFQGYIKDLIRNDMLDHLSELQSSCYERSMKNVEEE